MEIFFLLVIFLSFNSLLFYRIFFLFALIAFLFSSQLSIFFRFLFSHDLFTQLSSCFSFYFLLVIFTQFLSFFSVTRCALDKAVNFLLRDDLSEEIIIQSGPSAYFVSVWMRNPCVVQGVFHIGVNSKSQISSLSSW